MNIVGKWEKTTDTECGERYPQTIEFKANGIYFGKASSTSKLHPVWDAGSFHLAGQTISISTSNDAVIDYKIVLKDKKLSFKDAEGCMIEYVQN